MRYIFTLLFLIHYHNIHAQDLGRQKAGNETKRLKQEDTLEIKKLVSIAEKNTETNKDAALQAINRAISMLGLYDENLADKSLPQIQQQQCFNQNCQ